MDLTLLTTETLVVLLLVLVAEFSNGWSDAPVSTSSAVASGLLTNKQALRITALGNFFGLIAALILGAAVAKTIGTGIVQADIISTSSIGIAMVSTILWALAALWLGFPISKTHSLLAALAGIGYAHGGWSALLPESGNWHDSGWVAVGKGVFLAIVCGSAIAWFITTFFMRLGLPEKIPLVWWRRFQLVTVWAVSSGHGFNDGLKYVGIFTLVLYKGGLISEFQVLPSVIVLCAVVMGLGTLLGGLRIQRRLERLVNHSTDDQTKKSFKPHMGVCSELTSATLIWQSGFVGIPMSTNHSVTAAMAGAKSAQGKVHINSLVRIIWGWVITYLFCFWVAYLAADVFLN